MYDPRADEVAISTVTSSGFVYGGWHNPKDGKLNLLTAASAGGDRSVRRWRSKAYSSLADNNKATWKSKKILFRKPTSMGWVAALDIYPLPIAGTPPSYVYVLQVLVWADGTLIADYNISGNNGVYNQGKHTCWPLHRRQYQSR